MTPQGPDQGEHRDLELDSTFQRDDWPERLRAAVAETLAARQARRDLRTQLAERRDAGLERRHAEKLGRSNADRVSGDQGPTTAEPLSESATASQPDVDIRNTAQADALARLRRAGQGGWRPRRDGDA